MELLLVRHGESVANAEGKIQGQFDSPLNDRGREQAHALAQRLLRDESQIAAIYASDLSRAAETAEILASALELPVALDARLQEYDFGILTNVRWNDIQDLFPAVWQRISTGDWSDIPGEEGNEPFHARLSAAMDDIKASHGPDETVLLVSHGGSLGMMLIHLLGLPIRRPTPFRLANTSLNVVEIGAHRTLLLRINDTCHLDGDLS